MQQGRIILKSHIFSIKIAIKIINSLTKKAKLKFYIIIMYTYIELGNHQHKVKIGTIFHAECTKHLPDDIFECDKVVMLAVDKEKIQLGKPYVQDIKVQIQVLANIKSPKIYGFKYKKRKGYRKSWGHRQNLQKMKVLKIIEGAAIDK